MRYATMNDLPSISYTEERTLLSEAIFKTSADTFISHSSKDNDKIPRVIKFLENQGFSPYVDINDPGLGSVTGKYAAEKLRKKIKRYSKFIVLLSENTNTSKWIPWELGLADGIRGNENIFLLPVRSHSYDTIEGQEYFQLYQKFVVNEQANRWEIF